MVTPPRAPLLPPDLQRQVQAELRPGERLVWAAQPLPRLLRWQSLGLFLFAIPWTAFAVFWVAAAAHGTWHHGHPAGAGFLFPLFGLPFVVIGVGMLSAPPWAGRTARQTAYAITDQRAVVFRGRAFGRRSVDSFEPDRLTGITRNERADGTGDLIFEQFAQRRGTGTSTVRRGFLAIGDVRPVEDLIYNTLLAGRTRAARGSGDGSGQAGL